MAELNAQTLSVQSLYSWFADNRLLVNRRYQRKLVWTLEEKQRLIESILKRYPIPAILIAERENAPGIYEIIDGLQRLHTIVSFIETAFPSVDAAFFNLEFFPTAKSRGTEGQFTPNTAPQKLQQKEVSSILDYPLALSVMRGATETEVNDVFSRINTYGHRLSEQERRQAGVETSFSTMVREIACAVRGDISKEILFLKEMPMISVDMPKARYGYEVKAEEVFWVIHGILLSTDLRDSMDEQCVADIAASIVCGQVVERSKDALDRIYDVGKPESTAIESSLEIYGPAKFSQEFKFCIETIAQICGTGTSPTVRLRNLLFKNGNTNAFSSVFAVFFIALHEALIKEGKAISNFDEARNRLVNLASHIQIGKGATSSEQRRKNIDIIKGLLAPSLIPSTKKIIYSNHAAMDIENELRRSEIEVSAYELKQGLLLLSGTRPIDSGIPAKVVNTICAIANNGPNSNGKILIGITDKDGDASRIEGLDNVTAIKVGTRQVVGVKREAKILGLTTEEYFGKWKDIIRNSELSSPLKETVLSNMDFNEFYGLGVIVLSIPSQTGVSYVGEDVFWRNGESTEKASSFKLAASIASRF